MVTRALASLVAAAVATAASATVIDVNGVPRQPLVATRGSVAAAFFVSHDCPISNHYAREIRRICTDYAGRGVVCSLIYVDSGLSDAAAQAHATAYAHDGYPVIVDRTHVLVRAAGVRVTPEVAVLNDRGTIAYRGRIDDFYVSWGTSRRAVSDRSLRRALDATLAGRAVVEPRTDAVGCFIPGPR